MQESKAKEMLDAIADGVWSQMLAGEQGVLLRLSTGLPLTQMPDLSYKAAEQDCALARETLNQLAEIPTDQLDHQDLLSLEIIRADLQMKIEGLQYYWLSFPVTPYTGGYLLNFVHQAIEAAPVFEKEARRTYLGLVKGYAKLLDQMRDKLHGQSERGILLPKPAIPDALSLFSAFQDKIATVLTVDSQRLSGVSEQTQTAFNAEIDTLVRQQVIPAFKQLLDYLGDDYQARAPETVGLYQYPDGKQYYGYLARLYTLPDETPESLFSYGKQRVTEIAEQMQLIRDQLGFFGTQAEFHQQLTSDSRFLAKTPSDVEERFNGYIRRIEPLIDDYFLVKPKAPYGVSRLDPSQEAGMTYGYYQPPTKDNPSGQYRYNGANLESRPLMTAGHLIYHELIPGHHFHMALQQENKQLPLIRSKNFSLTLGGFHEGWAEYAASLALEMGLLDEPYDQYGHLLMEMLLTVRLVVDPGLNYFGWPLEKAQHYMKQHCFLPDREVESETLRYASGIPGQSLGYKIGHRKMHELRQYAEDSLGEDFDIRHFHAALVGSGAMRLEILEKHINGYIQQNQ